MKPLKQALGRRNVAQTLAWAGYHLRRAVCTPVARVNPTPVLLMGNQKSGTTAVADLLAKMTGCSVTLDIPAFAGDLALRILAGQTSLEQAVRRNRYEFSHTIVKEPWLTFVWDDMARLFPGAPTLFIVRDPRQNIRSILNRLSVPGNLDALSQSTLRAMKPGWRAAFELELRERGEGLHYVEALAWRWNRAAEAYGRHAGQCVLLRYEDWTRAKAQVLQDTAVRLGLQPRRDITALVDRQYQPRGDRSVSPAEFFGERNLRRVDEICGPLLERFGYK